MLSPGIAQREIDRDIPCPRQAPSYMVGRPEIMRLREEARATLGDRFDIRAFHDQVLEFGTIPRSLLRMRIERWVAAGGG